MPEVDIEKEIREEEARVKSSPGIETKRVGAKTFFKGPYLEKWFDNYNEMLRINEEFKSIAELKRLGLNAQAQTKEQEIRKEIMVQLSSKRAKIVDDLRELDVEIRNLRVGRGDIEKHKKK